ncbi:glycosyltransferase family 2 protein [Chitinophaga sp. 30R24]|uniref:glycosyltransferase family 2 protein n=1 Tax=Chitinophaga sp. 30R24 TaxID=3248838 RepID=UPI003B8EDC54
MKNPLVSIIVPVYNLAPYLPHCIASLLQQTYAPLEIIFVDDASTDDSLQVLTDYQQKHTHIQVHTQPNGGPGPARNTGLDHASGEFVLFVDGDDWIAPETVEMCMQEALKEAADIVCFGFSKVCKPGNELENIKVLQVFEYFPENFSRSDFIESFFSEATHWADKLNTSTCGKLYKRNLLTTHQIRFRLPIFEDSPFFLEAVYHSRIIRFISGSYYQYLIREKTNAEKSITTQAISTHKIAHFYAADELMRNFLQSKGIFHQYCRSFERYHNTRILQYGGYFETYVEANGQCQQNQDIFLQQLRQHRHTLTLSRKGLYRAFRKRIVFLNIGSAINLVSPRLTNTFFRWYEKTLAPK